MADKNKKSDKKGSCKNGSKSKVNSNNKQDTNTFEGK